MSNPYSRPRTLTASWLLLLAAPVAWSGALGVLWSLTDEVCDHVTRGSMWWSAGVSIVLALAPAPLAWMCRRNAKGTSAAGERLRFMTAVAVGVSMIFALTLLLSAVSILWLSPCRT